MNIALNKNDEIVMKLLHYFITVEGYNPVVLHGAKDEIWLEKSDADYKIIRIVSNYIHNNEQLDFDIFRTKQIVKKIKTKMFSFKINTLSIFINLGDSVDLNNKTYDNIFLAKVKEVEDLSKYSFIIDTFPNIINVEDVGLEGVELFVKLTEDINRKNFEETKKAEEIFSKKKPLITYIIIALCVIVYIVTSILSNDFLNNSTEVLYMCGGLINKNNFYSNIEFIRLFSSMFLHASFIHLACNMYSLYMIGPQLESFFGKFKFTIIYIMSGVIGGLLSMLFQQDNVISVGASGAIFGLLGSLLYFGYYYRVYLGNAISSYILPIIILNFIIGYMISGVNVVAHFGGLIGGVLTAKSVGIKYKTKKLDRINGIIMLIIFIISLVILMHK